MPGAIDELAEETGIEVEKGDLVPFGCLSESEAHTIQYSNRDVTIASPCSPWPGAGGEPNPNRDEATEAGFFELDTLSEPMHAPTDRALDLLAAYRRSATFQVR